MTNTGSRNAITKAHFKKSGFAWRKDCVRAFLRASLMVYLPSGCGLTGGGSRSSAMRTSESAARGRHVGSAAVSADHRRRLGWHLVDHFARPHTRPVVVHIERPAAKTRTASSAPERS